MTNPQSLIYISSGDLPSLWANTVQTAKMAQAFSDKVRHFELLTSGDIVSTFRGMDSDFKNWYGLEKKYNLTRIPVHRSIDYPFPKSYWNRRYFDLSVLYTCLKSPVLAYTRNPLIVELMAGHGVPIIWEHHEPILPKSQHSLLLKITELIGMVTTSTQLAKTFVKSGFDRKDVFVAPNAVDMDDFSPEVGQSEARSQLDLPLSKSIALYSGHLYDYKGIPNLLNVAKLLPDCLFLLVGGWKDDAERVRLICKDRQLLNVHVVGHVKKSDLATYLFASDICLLPTSQTWEQAHVTCPLKLFDYMAARRPIVSSALPTIMQTIQDQETALLVEPDNPRAWEEAISSLLNQPSLSQRLAENAFQQVKTLTWERRAAETLKFASAKLNALEPKSSNPRLSIARQIFHKIRKRFKH
ncbi:MAG: glycosyltransferase family 4 protein [Leptolyngbyaceae cyanobacterium]